MSGPAAAALPLSAVLLAALVLAVGVIARRVASHELTAPVARSLPQTSPPRTQLVAVAPPAAAAVHAAVLVVGELSWPRPDQRFRSARLSVRSVRHQAPPGTGVLSRGPARA